MDETFVKSMNGFPYLSFSKCVPVSLDIIYIYLFTRIVIVTGSNLFSPSISAQVLNNVAMFLSQCDGLDNLLALEYIKILFSEFHCSCRMLLK